MVCINTNIDQDVEELIIKRKGGGSIIDQKPLFSCDGQILYITCANVVRAYSVQTGELLRDYEGLNDNIVGVQFDPHNSRLLIACSESGEIATWKCKSGVYHSKIQLQLKPKFCLNTFHLIALKNEESEILVSWKFDGNKEYHFGIFDLLHGKIASKFHISFKDSNFKVSVGGQYGSQFMTIVHSNRMYNVDLIKKRQISRCNIKKGFRFTCVACHPEYDYVLTGEESGRILLWQGIFYGERTSQAIYHWHTLPVACLAFTQTGSHFYSGGHERVLVKWTVDNPTHYSVLPRLSGGICHVTVGPENYRVAISTHDNGVQILDSQNRIMSCIQHFAWGVYTDLKNSKVPKTVSEPPFPAGLVYDPTTQAIVMNGHTGHVQFYSTHSRSLLYKVDITQHNQMTAERNLEIINIAVILVAIGVTSNQYPDSNTWMATVEHRDDKVTHFESRLKFWEYNSEKQSFSLNTCIDYPHVGRVLDVKFQSVMTVSDGKHFLCATCGEDNRLKIWSLTDASDIYKKKKHWLCVGSAKHKDLPVHCVGFSMDGSLVACGFGPCITIWQPDNLALKCSLTHVGPQSDVKKVLFGNGSMGHLLVSCNSTHLVVWDVMSLRSLWMVNISVDILVGDPVSTYMAAFTNDNMLYIFQPNCSKPICKKDLSKIGQIKHALWVPNQNVYNYKINWQEYSQLYFLNSNQELLCLESNLEEDFATSSSTTSEPQQLSRTAFGAIVASQRNSAVATNNSSVQNHLGVTGSNSVKELLLPAPHSLPPVHLLCSGLLRAMLGLQAPVRPRNQANNTTPTPMEIEDSDDEEIVKHKDSEQNVRTERKSQFSRQLQDGTLESIWKENDEWVQNVLV